MQWISLRYSAIILLQFLIYYKFISNVKIWEDALPEERHSITCKLCNVQFESLGDMQRHVVAEHFQKGDIPKEKKEEK